MSTESTQTEKAKLTPEQVLMNCLAGAERIDHILIITFDKEGDYEFWSNHLPAHVRLGMAVMTAKRITDKLEDVDIEDGDV